MADRKVTQLTDLGTSIASEDLFHVVDDPSGTPINKRITTKNIFNNIPDWLGFRQTAQALTAAGDLSDQAINVTTSITTIDSTSSASNHSLTDGGDGQLKMIINVSTAGTNAQTITPSNMNGGTSVVLNAPGESAQLLFKAGNWTVIGGRGFTIVA